MFFLLVCCDNKQLFKELQQAACKFFGFAEAVSSRHLASSRQKRDSLILAAEASEELSQLEKGAHKGPLRQRVQPGHSTEGNLERLRGTYSSSAARPAAGARCAPRTAGVNSCWWERAPRVFGRCERRASTGSDGITQQPLRDPLQRRGFTLWSHTASALGKDESLRVSCASWVLELCLQPSEAMLRWLPSPWHCACTPGVVVAGP